MKHQLSPAPLPPSKRAHTFTDLSLDVHNPRLAFDTLLFDEIILLILSHLSWTDLCAVQATNRNLSRLSLDNQLWKTLYISEYGRSRLRGGRGFIGRGDGREVKPLPGRAKGENAKDWKWMFRISSNWRTGRCSVEQFDMANFLGSLSQAAQLDETHLLLAGNVTVAASSRPSSTPTVVVSSPAHTPHILRCPSSRGHTAYVTALALDQSPPTSGQHGRLVSFLSTGEFVLYSIDHQSPSASSRLFTYVPSGRSSRYAPIVHAVYHHPLLVTLSQSFHLSVYDISENTVRHAQTLTSFTSYPPSSLVLSTPSATTYKLVLAYAIPVYPSHWSVGATELIISNTETEHMVVSSTRTTRAVDVPQGWLDENKMRAIREQWGRKVARVADTQTDGKWVVLAPGHDIPTITILPAERHTTSGTIARDASLQPSSRSGASSASSPTGASSPSFYKSSSLYSASGLQLYRLHLPSSPSSSASPKLTFVRTLHGQIGPVSALALADGRCVSLGVNGSIWVWDLEAGTGTEVSAGVMDQPSDEGEGEGEGEDDERRAEAWEVVKMRIARGARGSVVFDDRRIVSACGRGVEVRRFDV
ncbi:hypothetical protein L227DRAFT_374274 [Lentinus tigrinus ALCF2SS1-6]|uniref:F-box domain-containing protein n=1 Tax=Lentinus tigrinus ALCF2SS1-6 TaxID=1328759 RepID=A0A5C2RUW4_9APHY|nr:hypothetical protein L227DRAFT_374274 [Lentinus tigrinus ALCF2SS1-6]